MEDKLKSEIAIIEALISKKLESTPDWKEISPLITQKRHLVEQVQEIERRKEKTTIITGTSILRKLASNVFAI